MKAFSWSSSSQLIKILPGGTDLINLISPKMFRLSWQKVHLLDDYNYFLLKNTSTKFPFGSEN